MKLVVQTSKYNLTKLMITKVEELLQEEEAEEEMHK